MKQAGATPGIGGPTAGAARIPQHVVLRTGAGSLPSAPVIQGLQRLGCRVIAADADPLSVGFLCADEYAVIPPARSPEFKPSVLDVCRERGVDVILPAVNEEISVLDSFRDDLRAHGVTLVAPNRAAIAVCLDKLLTARALERLDLPGPRTVDAQAGWNEPFPCVAKPRAGRGSRGVVVVESRVHLEFLREQWTEPYVLQEFLAGEEFTIDMVATHEGELRMATARRRLRVSAGISVAGEITSVRPFQPFLERLTRELLLTGPSCVQCIHDVDGTPRFTDLNPRLGGGVALSLAGGTPILEGTLAWVEGSPIEEAFDRGLGMRFLRRYEEVYLAPSHPV